MGKLARINAAKTAAGAIPPRNKDGSFKAPPATVRRRPTRRTKDVILAAAAMGTTMAMPGRRRKTALALPTAAPTGHLVPPG